MKYQKFILLMILLLSIGATATEKATINTNDAFIEAPYISYGRYLEGTAHTKIYTGNVNVLFGFDKDIVTPKSIEFEKTVVTTTQKQCNENFRIVSNRAICEVIANDTSTVLWNEIYTSVNSKNAIIQYESKNIEKEKLRSYYTIEGLEYDNKSTWFMYPNQYVSPTTPYSWRMAYNTPIGSTVKYDIAFYPSFYGYDTNAIINAYSNGDLYLLDPFYNNSNYEVGNVSNTSATWTLDNGTGTTLTVFDTYLSYPLEGQISSLTDAILYYSYDTDDIGVGTRQVDISGNSNDMVSNFASTGSTGIVGESYNYVRSNPDYSIFDESNDLVYTASDEVTFSGWFKTGTTGQYQNIFSYRPKGSNPLFLIGIENTNILRFYWSTNGGAVRDITSASTYTDDNWHHFCAIRSTGTNYLRVDGVQIGTSTTAQTGVLSYDNSSNTYDRWVLGSSYELTSNGFDGELDEVSIFNRELSSSECDELYNSGNGINPYKSSIDYNTSKNLYVSDVFPIVYNISSFLATGTSTGVGSYTVNISCDGGNTWSGSVTSGLETACSTIGDSLQYEIQLTGGNISDSPIMQNLTIEVYESVIIPTIPTVSKPTFNPSAPNSTQDITGSTTYIDNDGDNGTIFFYWQINGSNVYNETKTATNNSLQSSILSSSYTGNTDVVTLYVNATDGTNTSTTKSTTVIISNVTPTSEITLPLFLIDAFVYMLFLVLIIASLVVYLKTHGVLYISSAIIITIFMFLAVWSDLAFSTLIEYRTYLSVIPLLLLAICITILFED